MRTKTGDAIFKLLQQHQGRATAISAPDICRELDYPPGRERQVRRIIADESALWPDVVCATPGAGYFCATSYEEIATYDNWLNQLVTEATDKLNAFRTAAKNAGFNIIALPALAAAA